MASLALGFVLAIQVQIGTVRGNVLDPSGAGLNGARVSLHEWRTGFERVTFTEGGGFVFENVPLGVYGLRVEAAGFRPHDDTVRLSSNIPAERLVELELAGPEEEVTVRPETPLVEGDRTSGTTRLDESFLRDFPGGRSGQGLQELVATAAGWSTEDNGLMHARGVDDGFLFVVDGIPLQDRVDTLFSSSLDVASFQSLEILDGHLPAEYGNASGGVINVVLASGLSRPWNATASARAGSQASGAGSLSFGGSLTEALGLFTSVSFTGSGDRFLDPVDPDNFNNGGSSLQYLSRVDWRGSARDLFVLGVSANGSGFRVPNSFEQELAGQRQRQRLRDDHESLLWQRAWSASTVTELAAYRHAVSAELLPSAEDVPLSASQDRRHERLGLLVNVTHERGGHSFKAGVDVQKIEAREHFSFFVTDEAQAERAGISDDALAFGAGNPFRFDEDVTRGQVAAFVQDTFSPFDRLTVNAGLRFDSTSMLVAASQLSPRIGAVYYVEPIELTVRGSYNRLFMPPQIENLLLSSSRQARALSPFVTNEGEGGAVVAPEGQHAIEVGFAKALGAWAVLDAAYWYRRVQNFADPNVFFGTTVVFPNSVASGTAAGVNARILLPLGRSFSGFLSYGNALVYQRGPINGGLFLEEEVIEIGPGTRFAPDHDQRNVAAFGWTYRHASSGARVSLYGRHESGTPLEAEEDEIDELLQRRGAELVDFDRMRVRPRTLLDVSAGIELLRSREIALDLQLDVRNVTNERFAFNFSNPFSGTHFGYPRLLSFRLRASF